MTPESPMARGLPLLIAALLLAPSAAAVERDSPLPALTFAMDDAPPISSESLRGSVVLITLWASWCAPCLHELPDLQASAEALRTAGVRVIAVNLDEDRARAEAVVSTRGLTLPVAWDPKGELAAKLEPPTMPTAYLVDKEGVVRHVETGSRQGSVASLVSRALALSGTVGSPNP